MSTANLSREQRIYLAIWRKAYRERDGEKLVTIKASSHSMAITLCRNLYRAVKPYRDGTIFDNELRQAAEAFVVSVAKHPDPNVVHELTLQPRLTLTELEANLHDMGLEEADLLSLEEQALSGLVPKPEDTPAKSNPFYTREG